MSADTTPISPARFAAALPALSVEMLHLKVLEIRNSIAHLQYSNDQLKPFAEGESTTVTSTSSTAATTAGANGDSNAAGAEDTGDPDCKEAIRENDIVIDRMAERIALIRIEVEQRGVSWTEFQSKDEVETQTAPQNETSEDQDTDAQDITSNTQAASTQNGTSVTNGMNGTNGTSTTNGTHGSIRDPSHPAWSDGTFQTGTIRNGEVLFDSVPGQREGGQTAAQGGSLSDEQLRRAMEEQMRNLTHDDDEEDGGMHL